MRVAKLGRKAMPTPARIGRAIVDALIGAVIGVISSALAGALSCSVGLATFHVVTILIRGGPSDNSLGIGFSIVAGAMQGLFAMPVGPVVGAVLGAVMGVRSFGGVIAVVCGAGIGAVAGLLAGVGAILGSFISHDGPFHYLAHVFRYLAYNSLLGDVLFITASGASVGIGAGVVIGRMLRRQQTVI